MDNIISIPVEQRVCWGDWYINKNDSEHYEVIDGATHMQTGERLIIMRNVETAKVLACPTKTFDYNFEKLA
jgi:hypothetical protein